MELQRFGKLPLLGILRGVEANAVAELAECAVAAGLEAIEITMNTADAAELIRRMVDAAAGRLMIGAGTVLCARDLQSALDAGATFIVSPTLVSEVVDRCVERSVPVFPGALTPQEIHNAWSAGATMVKVFPAKFFGPDYFKEIKGPFADIKLLACGGVSPDNVASFFAAGASAVAFGASVFRHDWLAARQFDHIEESIRTLVQRVREAQPI